jgi:hypothetical protein
MMERGTHLGSDLLGRRPLARAARPPGLRPLRRIPLHLSDKREPNQIIVKIQPM